MLAMRRRRGTRGETTARMALRAPPLPRARQEKRAQHMRAAANDVARAL